VLPVPNIAVVGTAPTNCSPEELNGPQTTHSGRSGRQWPMASRKTRMPRRIEAIQTEATEHAVCCGVPGERRKSLKVTDKGIAAEPTCTVITPFYGK